MQKMWFAGRLSSFFLLCCLPQLAWGQANHAASWRTTTVITAPAPHAAPLSFTAALAQAWQLDPTRKELATNRAGARSRAHAARSWFAGGPILNGSYFDDHAIGSNEGYTTYQGEVSVPLWLPGQGSATQAVAEAEAATAEKRADMTYMSLAVQVLDATAATLFSAKRAAAAQAYLAGAEHLKTNMMQAAHMGEMTQVDTQQAEATRDTAQADYAAAQQELQTTHTALQALVGTSAIPDLDAFTDTQAALSLLRNITTLETEDPRIQTARLESAAAQAALKLARRSFMPNPELGVGAIHEKQYASPWDNRVGVNFTMPLPSSVHNAPLLSAAKDRIAAADRQEALAQRMVRQEILQIKEQLTFTEQSAHAARDAANTLTHRADLLEKSWKLHETPFDDVIRARQTAYVATLAHNKADIAWHVTIARALIAAHTLHIPTAFYNTATQTPFDEQKYEAP